MSEEIQTSEESSSGMDRRSVLKRGALIAGVAAFAQPVVAGVFSSPAAADYIPPDRCNPALDSDAIDVLGGGDERWNLNCDANSKYGRYNAQRSQYTIPGTNLQVSIVFGQANTTDNLPVECSYYTIVKPAGYDCQAEWALQDGSKNAVCNLPGDNVVQSVPGDCIQVGTKPVADFTAPTGALPIPYCKPKSDSCPSGFKLVLLNLYCCPG